MLLAFVAVILAGPLYALGLPGLGFTFFLGPFIATTIWLLAISKRPLTHTLAITFAFTASATCFGIYWVPQTIHIFAGLPLVVAYLCGALFSPAVLSFLWPMLIPLKLAEKYHWSKSWQFTLLALALTLIEWISPQQFVVYSGSSWLNIAPYVGMAPIGGVFVYSLWTYLVATTVLQKRIHGSWNNSAIGLSAVFVLVHPFIPLNWQGTQKTKIRIVQADVGRGVKVPETNSIAATTKRDVNSYVRMSSKPGAELIIWPETAFPYPLDIEKIKKRERSLPYRLRQVLSSSQAVLVTGGYDAPGDAYRYSHYETEYNSAMVFAPDGRALGVYHKIILIPFGETLPFGPLNKWLSDKIPGVSYFKRGSRLNAVKLEGLDLTALLPICYEVLESGFLRKALNKNPESNVFINLTNDSWYGDTSEPHQHKFLAHWRALEFQRPIIRSTNTGISSVLYPDGSESKQIPYNVQGVLDHELRTRLPKSTFYQNWGIWPWVFLILLLGIFQRQIGTVKIK